MKDTQRASIITNALQNDKISIVSPEFIPECIKMGKIVDSGNFAISADANDINSNHGMWFESFML